MMGLAGKLSATEEADLLTVNLMMLTDAEDARLTGMCPLATPLAISPPRAMLTKLTVPLAGRLTALATPLKGQLMII